MQVAIRVAKAKMSPVDQVNITRRAHNVRGGCLDKEF